MTLLEDGVWQGKVWTGSWADGSGGTYDAVEPATGDVIAPVGRATPEDVHTAAVRAVEAQKAWAALPFEERAAVLRRATLGLDVNAGNTHPFTDGRIAFAHNGSIRPPASLDRLLSERSQRRRQGTTDSERYFLAVVQRLRDGAAPAEALRTTADEIAATADFTSLNCLLLTPDRLYAFSRYDADNPPDDDDPEYYNLRYRVTPDGVVVASSGWGRDWQELANGELLVVRRRTLECTVDSGAGVPA